MWVSPAIKATTTQDGRIAHKNGDDLGMVGLKLGESHNSVMGNQQKKAHQVYVSSNHQEYQATSRPGG